MRFFLSFLLYIFISIAIFTMTGPGDRTMKDKTKRQKKAWKMNILNVNRLLVVWWLVYYYGSRFHSIFFRQKSKKKKNTKISCIFGNAFVQMRQHLELTNNKLLFVNASLVRMAQCTLHSEFESGVNNNQKWRCWFFSFFSAMHLIMKWMFGFWVSIFELFR